MEGTTSLSRPVWNCRAVLVALCVAILLQFIVLPCLCYAGTLKLSVALMVDALVLARVVLAKARHERGRGWVFYAALPFLVVPVLLIVFGH